MGENRLAAFFADMGKKDPTPSLYKYLDTPEEMLERRLKILQNQRKTRQNLAKTKGASRNPAPGKHLAKTHKRHQRYNGRKWVSNFLCKAGNPKSNTAL